MPVPRDILLVGAGHAHLGVIHNCGDWGHRVSVVSPGDFWYSGLATGMLGGRYRLEDDRVDVAELCRRVGATFIHDEMTGIDAPARQVTLRSGRRLDYDVLSLDVGSEVRPPPGLDADGERIFTVKPISQLADLRNALERLALRLRKQEADDAARRSTAARWQDVDHVAGDVARGTAVVVGGGNSGCEAALNLLVHSQKLGVRLAVFLVKPPDPPTSLKDVPADRKQFDLHGYVRGRGVAICPGRVTGHSGWATGGLLFDGENTQEYPPLRPDLVVVATGLHPPGLVRDLGLPLTEAGRLRIGPTLQVEGQERVFAAGDCATLADRDLPKIGVVAVRQGAVLRNNLPAAAEGRKLKRYRPQKRHLLILNLGDGTGLAMRGGWHYQGRGAMWLKDWIDQHWIRSLRNGGR